MSELCGEELEGGEEERGLKRVEEMEVGELPSGPVGIGLESSRRLSLG